MAGNKVCTYCENALAYSFDVGIQHCRDCDKISSRVEGIISKKYFAILRKQFDRLHLCGENLNPGDYCLTPKPCKRHGPKVVKDPYFRGKREEVQSALEHCENLTTYFRQELMYLPCEELQK